MSDGIPVCYPGLGAAIPRLVDSPPPHLPKTPPVQALGGDPVSPLTEDIDDRLYTVFVSESGVRSTLVSFCGT